MLKGLIETIISVIGLNGDSKAQKKVTIEMKQKQPKFMSLFLLGEGFYTYHEDVKTKDFIAWLKKNHETWHKVNADLVKSLPISSLKELVEAIYRNSQKQDGDKNLTNYFRKWYIQEHGLFSFSTGDRVFIPLYDGGYLLQVLYNAQEKEIIQIGSVDDVSVKLTSPEDFRNNWFVGIESSNTLEASIASHLIANADIQTAHYKLINNDNATSQHYIELLKGRGITNYVEIPFQTVTTIPNDEITIKRFNRYEQFNDFAINAETIFKQFLKESPEAKRFDDFFTLSIWNDKNHPKNDVTYVNVAFGSRPLTISHHNKGFTSSVEEGARLTFYRMETGEVLVTLYPAKTDSRKPIEDAIVLTENLAPKKLSDNKRLKKYWKQFISYMECTSIDGNPSYRQKKAISNLRYTKHLIIKDVFQPETRRSELWHDIRKFVLTVGLSGFVFYILTFVYNMIYPNKSFENGKNEVIQHIDSLQDAVRQAGDSINLRIIKSQGVDSGIAGKEVNLK